MSTITHTGASFLESLHISSASGKQRSSMELGQDDFLELMLAQLKNQDPMKPMESGEFLSQLAQFGTVNGIRSLQSSANGLLGTLQSVQALQASNLVGRSVLVKGEVWVKEGPLSGMIELPTQATKVQVMVLDSSGQRVRKIDLGAHDAGRVSFDWNGITDEGQPAPPGQYQLKAEATVGGQNVAVETRVRGQVDSVTLGQGGTTLNLGPLGTVDLSQVSEIF